MLTQAKSLNGYNLQSIDRKIGNVKEFYFDDHHWTIRYIVADTGDWLTGRQVLISPYALEAVNKAKQYIAVGLTKRQIEGSPSLDVAQYELFRTQEKDSISQKLKTWKTNLPETYEDIPEEQGKSYYYKIRTTDFSGNSSKYERMVYFPFTAKNTIKLRAEQAGNGRSVFLSWDVPEGFKPIKTILYRSTGAAPFSICSTMEGSAQVVTDSDVEINTYYKYMIKIIGENGSGIVSGQVSISGLSFSDTKNN